MNLFAHLRHAQFICEGHTFQVTQSDDPALLLLECTTCKVSACEPVTALAGFVEGHLQVVATASAKQPQQPYEPGLVPCQQRAWCLLVDGHEGPCQEIPRTKIPTNDFGPRRKP